jgi:membrane-associated HD superfamily phosphohydrolase
MNDNQIDNYNNLNENNNLINDNNNNLGDLNLNNADNNLNLNNNDNNNLNDFDDGPNKTTILFVLISALSLVLLDIVSLWSSYNDLTYYLSRSDSYYNQCNESMIVSEIIFTVFATMVGISATILSIGFLINTDYFLDKFLNCFVYFNYFIFGPFLLCTSIFGFINFNKIGYTCEYDPKNVSLNISMLICLIFISTLGSIITVGFSTFNIFEYFQDSIKFTNDSDYILGKTFWKVAMPRIRNLHERNE